MAVLVILWLQVLDGRLASWLLVLHLRDLVRLCALGGLAGCLGHWRNGLHALEGGLAVSYLAWVKCITLVRRSLLHQIHERV